MHIARGLFYSSYRTPRVLVWNIGVIIFILMMATAFLGYNHSPKWSKFNNTKSIYTFNNKYKFNINKNIPRRAERPTFTLGWEEGRIQRRSYSRGAYVNDLSKTLIDFNKDKNLTPVYSYENLQLNETRNRIIQETKGLSGIYLILNKVTLDFYIGSASTGRFYARFSRHLIYLTGSKIIKLAVKKYKLSNFAFLILELFPEVINKENNKKLLDREDLYLKSMLPNYNILTEAGSSFGYKHTELDRIKMKSNYSLERRLRIGNLNKGKTLTPEIIEKIRNKALGRDKTKINIPEQSLLNMKKRSKAIILFNLDRTVFGEYSSITDAAKSVNCNIKTIHRALKTDKKILKRRFIVNYIENK